MTDYTPLLIGITAMVLLLLLGIWLMLPHTAGRPMGINVTHIDNATCRYTWLGGIDYNSFVRDIRVGNDSIGHPDPGAVIHTGNCNVTVDLYMLDTRTYQQIWPNRVM